jgi:hypothetical protein
MKSIKKKLATMPQIAQNWIGLALGRNAHRIPHRRGGFLDQLSFHASHDWGSGSHFDVSKPSDVDLELLCMVYVRLFAREEFEHLRRALPPVIRRWAMGPLGLPPTGDGFASWLDDILTVPVGISRTGTEALDLSDDLKHVRRMDIQLQRLAPSNVIISIRAYPSDSMQERFQGLITSRLSSRETTTHISLIRRRIRSSSISEERSRRKQVWKLLDDMRGDIDAVSRPFVLREPGRGHEWSESQVYVLRAGDPTKDRDEHRGFWGALGVDHSYPPSYVKGRVRIFRPRQRDEIKEVFRAVIDERLRTQPLAGDDIDRDLALRLQLDDEVGWETLEAIVAVGAEADHLLRAVSILRGKISPVLVRPAWRGRPSSKWRDLENLNQLAFKLKRLETECTRAKLMKYWGADILGYRREAHSDRDTGELADDLWWFIERQLRLAREQLDILERSYSDHHQLLVQRSMGRLTWVGILVAAVGLVSLLPEECRSWFLEWLAAIFGR